MNSKINEILHELYEFDSSLKNDEEKLKKLVTVMVENKPNIILDYSFKANLKSQLESRYPQKKLNYRDIIKYIWTFMWWAAVAFSFMFIIKPSVQIDEIKTEPLSLRTAPVMTLKTVSEDIIEEDTNSLMMDSMSIEMEDAWFENESLLESQSFWTLEAWIISEKWMLKSNFVERKSYNFNFKYLGDINIEDYKGLAYYSFEAYDNKYPQTFKKLEIWRDIKIKSAEEITDELSNLNVKWYGDNPINHEVLLSDPKLVYSKVYLDSGEYFVPALSFQIIQDEITKKNYYWERFVINLIDLK